MDCWFEMIDIETYMETHYNKVEREKIFTPPEDKVASLIGLIEKARQKK